MPEQTANDPSLPMDFDLEDAAVSAPAEPQPPGLKGADRKRAQKYVRSLLDLADKDNDGHLSSAVAHSFIDLHQQTNQILVARMKALHADNMASIATWRKQNAEPGTAAPLMRPRIDLQTLIPDDALLNCDMLIGKINENTSLSRPDIDRIVRRVLPHGVADVKLSDECAHAGVSCTPLTPTTMMLSLKQGPEL